MTVRNYARLAALLFALIAVLQFIRAVGGWEIVVNGTLSVPVWASWIACVIAAGLAWIGLVALSNEERKSKEERKRRRKQEREERRKQEREERRSELSGSTNSLS